MLLMPSTDKPFKSMAESIATRFFSDEEGKTLTQLVAEEARDADMVPEEVKRLVEKTNTAASIAFLSSASENKKGSFDLARYEDVLALTHPAADTEDEEPEEPEDDDDDEDEDGTEKIAAYLDTACERPRQTKTASAVDAAFDVPAYKYASAPASDDSYRNMLAMRRYLTTAKQEKTAEEVAAKADIDWLISEFNRWNGPDFDKFASESVALYGNEAKPIINGIASYLGIKAHLSKTAAYIDDSDRYLVKLGSAIEHLGNLVTLTRGIEMMERAEEHFRKAAC